MHRHKGFSYYVAGAASLGATDRSDPVHQSLVTRALEDNLAMQRKGNMLQGSKLLFMPTSNTTDTFNNCQNVERL